MMHCGVYEPFLVWEGFFFAAILKGLFLSFSPDDKVSSTAHL